MPADRDGAPRRSGRPSTGGRSGGTPRAASGGNGSGAPSDRSAQRRSGGGRPVVGRERGTGRSDGTSARRDGRTPRDATDVDRARAPRPDRSVRADRPDRRDQPERSARPASSRAPRTSDRGSESERPRSYVPPLPDEARPELLPREILRALESLTPPTAEATARHLAAAGLCVDDDPERALAHARYAKERAPRVAETREALGVTAYAAGDFLLARGELRAARRMTGLPDLIPLLADCERALGRPAAALDLATSADASRLGREDRIELAIVAAGARLDLGEPSGAVAALSLPELKARPETATENPTVLRLWYAYADALTAAGRGEEGERWLRKVAEADEQEITDAAERLDPSFTDGDDGFDD